MNRRRRRIWTLSLFAFTCATSPLGAAAAEATALGPPFQVRAVQVDGSTIRVSIGGICPAVPLLPRATPWAESTSS